MRIIRTKEVALRVGYHPVHIKRIASDPRYAHMEFPRPVRIGDNSVGFVESEIDAWIAARIAERDGLAA